MVKQRLEQLHIERTKLRGGSTCSSSTCSRQSSSFIYTQDLLVDGVGGWSAAAAFVLAASGLWRFERARAQGRKRVIQRRLNVGVLEAIPKRKAYTL